MKPCSTGDMLRTSKMKVTSYPFERNQATVSLKTTHMDEDVGGGDLVLVEAGEVNGVNCAEVIADPVPVCVEKGR